MYAETLLRDIDPGCRKTGETFWLNFDCPRLKDIMKRLKEAGIYRLSAIVGVDLGDDIEIIYHLVYGNQKINLRTRVPKARPEIQTITGIYPGADLFERELMEMLGVKVKNHPNPKRLFLATDSPENPLRKVSSKPDRIVADDG